MIASAQTRHEEDAKLTEIWQPEPKVITPGKTPQDPPSDAIVLFNGKDFSQWESLNGGAVKWKLNEDFMMVDSGSGNIRTKQSFGDCQLHVEWRTPSVVKGTSQGRGNSGIFLMGLYELQVLDNYNNRTYSNGQAGSIYKQAIPLVNVCRPPGVWQTYDIDFEAAKFGADGKKTKNAVATVKHNGVVIHDKVEINGSTGGGKPEAATPGPIQLQGHGNPVFYRNVWVVEK